MTDYFLGFKLLINNILEALDNIMTDCQTFVRANIRIWVRFSDPGLEEQ